MKQYFSLLAVAAVAACSLTSCNEDEETIRLKPVVTSDGVFVVNSGHKSGGIEGTLTYYDYAQAAAAQKVYQAANGEALGETPNHAVVYGSKIYIVGSGEQTVFVADRKTLKKVENIKVEVNGKAATPRQAVAGYGFVYVSTYSNAVVAIDTLTNTITTTYKSGDYSEGMAIENGVLYVANSNYGQGKQENAFPSISVISLATKESVTFTDDLLNNPVDIKSANRRMFVLDSGQYDENWNQVGAGVFELSNGKVTKCADATEMAVSGTKVFMINAPYTNPTTEPTYKVYDTEVNIPASFCDGSDIKYPGKISVDPVKGYVYITSYNMGSSGYADYKAEGYCVIYNGKGEKQGEFDCGVGAGYVIPNASIEYVQQ